MVHPLLTSRMLAVHALAVVAVLAAALLGRWQYGAWQDGREDRTSALANVAPRPLGSVMTSDQAFPGASVGRPVQLSGRWVPRSTLYVADRELHGRDGVWAVTPVAVCRSSCAEAPAMLVVRGWAPSVADVPPAPTGRVQVTGWLQPGEGSGLTDPDPGDDVIPEMRIADAIQHVDQDLYGGYVIAREVSTGSITRGAGSTTRGAGSTTGGAGSTAGGTGSTTRGTGSTTGGTGLEAVTPASLPQATAFTSLRNLLYALEWWVFGGFAAYVWWRWCRDELAEGVEVPSTT